MRLDFLGNLQRTHTCGELRVQDDGADAVLMGWVNRRRDLGNLIFIDLRDRTGVTQVVFHKEMNQLLHEKASALRSEFVLAVKGRVKKRAASTVNKNISTGEIELMANEMLLLNDVQSALPFSPADSTLPNEELRLKYRYLDMRRPEMQHNIELRHKIALAIRTELNARGFFEIETPFMTRSTPEGARDYLVPSRVNPGQFYALPQSPQIFKQILMISGFDKYFQIVRCFRDEDLRADRQPEFTQIDLEITWATQERVFETTEGFLKAAFKAAGHELITPFPRMTYDEAMRQYGSDKPDVRLPAMTDVANTFTVENLRTLGIDPELPIVAVRLPKVGELSRKERDDNKALFDTKKGTKVIDDLKRLEKSFPGAGEKIKHKSRAADDDLVLIVAGDSARQPQSRSAKIPGRLSAGEIAVYSAAGNLRIELAKKYSSQHGALAATDSVAKHSRTTVAGTTLGDGAQPGPSAVSTKDAFRFLWVTDFPMFEYNQQEKIWEPAHHPFTSPHEEDMGRLQSDPASVRALAYDVVLNGMELGSGSIRIHREDVQKQIFSALGMSDREARSRFGFFLEALRYGTPPHGGIALGLDRIVMVLAGGDSLRDVIPFPKTAKAVDLMTDAPSPVSEKQLRELNISIKN